MNFDLSHIWASMGLMSKLVAFTLMLMAVASIAVVVERLLALAAQARETRAFTGKAKLALEAWDTPALIEVAERHPRSALARLVLAALCRYRRACEDPAGSVAPAELARRELARKREAIGADLRRGMSVLASVGSIAPFVGLLGTVVGIISAFQNIGATGSGGLGVVSAGIAEALIVTAFGLAVAIPAVLFFNLLSTKISVVELSLERSAGELADELENEHGRKRGSQLREAA